MKKTIYLVLGSQDLYGEETLKQVAEDGKKIAEYLNKQIEQAEITYYGTMENSDQITNMVKRINFEEQCIGIMVWCHTFSPAKMWINGLKRLQKPMAHLHTQANERLPYDAIDMDFMNLNQAAHGDREFGHICARLGLNNEIIVGYYKDPAFVEDLNSWISVVKGYDFSNNLKVARFGDNMREVAVTCGDKVAAQMQFGWQVNTFAVGDLVQEIAKVTDKEVDNKMNEYKDKYVFNTDNFDSVKQQAMYEIAMEKFFVEKGIGAYTNTFEDLHGMRQLPGLASQRLMDKGYGFGAEGDWKTSALGAVMMKMAEGKSGATGFMEDYTYDLLSGNELVLGAHMLEVPVSFSANKPVIEVHPLGIGGKEDPARLVFDGIEGEGIAVSLVDMGDYFKMIIANVELVKQPEPMPNLPVARVMWKIKPDFKSGAKEWIRQGGAHHTVVSTALTAKDLKQLANLWNIECVVIG